MDVMNVIGKFSENTIYSVEESQANDLLSKGFKIYRLSDYRGKIFTETPATIKVWINQKIRWNENSLFFAWQHKRFDGTIFDAEVSLNKVIIDGKPYLQAITRDVTERKKAEEELQKNIEELEKFRDVVVGRELKMVELKKRIKELYSKLNELKTPYYYLFKRLKEFCKVVI